MNLDTSQTCPHCGAPRIERDDVLVYWCGTVDKGTRFSRSLMCKDPMLLPKLLREIDELKTEQEAKPADPEVTRLKEMVMDAARRGDEMAAHWKERAEKAESVIKQLHHYAGIIEGFQMNL
jgi:uncharacterized Zn finger protein (UPF0148 family)